MVRAVRAICLSIFLIITCAAATCALAAGYPSRPLVLIDPSIVTNPVLHKKMPYDMFKDLLPISLVGSSPDVLVVAPQLQIKTFAAH